MGSTKEPTKTKKMKEKRPAIVEKESNHIAITNEYTGYKVPHETKEMDERGTGHTRYGFIEDTGIDEQYRHAKVSDFSIKASMEAGIDPSTRSAAPKVYGLDNNPEQLQKNIENYTQELDNELVVERYKQIKEEEEKKAKSNGTGTTTTNNV